MLSRLNQLLLAPFAAIHRHKLSLFAIELFVLPDFPFVKAMLAHAFFILVGFLFFGFVEGNDVVGHGYQDIAGGHEWGL